MMPDATLHQNRAFLFGDSLFETILIFKGIAYFLPQHTARLQAGMAALGIEGDASVFLQQPLAHLPAHATGRLRVQVWRAGAGAYAPETDAAQIASHFTPLARSQPYPALPPARCILSPDIRTLTSPVSAFKTGSALPYVLAARQARAAGADEALLLSADGFLAEASACNLFWIKDNHLFTPPLQTGCVAGIMRQQVMHLWTALAGTPVHEARLAPQALAQQEAVFLTNALRGIWPVEQVEEMHWPKIHPRIAELQQALIYKAGMIFR